MTTQAGLEVGRITLSMLTHANKPEISQPLLASNFLLSSFYTSSKNALFPIFIFMWGKSSISSFGSVIFIVLI
jgi:hypothetical protein